MDFPLRESKIVRTRLGFASQRGHLWSSWVFVAARSDMGRTLVEATLGHKRDIPPWCFLLAKAERAALSPSRIAAEMEMEDYSKVMVLGTRKVLFRVRNNRSVVVSTQYFSELRLRPSPRTSSSVALLPRRLNRPAARETLRGFRYFEHRCSGLIFLRHCNQPFAGSGMLDLTSDTTAPIRMVQQRMFFK